MFAVRWRLPVENNDLITNGNYFPEIIRQCFNCVYKRRRLSMHTHFNNKYLAIFQLCCNRFAVQADAAENRYDSQRFKYYTKGLTCYPGYTFKFI